MPRAVTLRRPLIEAVRRLDWAAAEERLRRGDRWAVAPQEETPGWKTPAHARLPNGDGFPEHDLLWCSEALDAPGAQVWEFLTRHGAPFYPALPVEEGRRELLSSCIHWNRLDLADWLVEKGVGPDRFTPMPFVVAPASDSTFEEADRSRHRAWTWWLDHTSWLSSATDGRSARFDDHLRDALTKALEYPSLISVVARLLASGADAKTVCPAEPLASPEVAIPGALVLAQREGGSALHVLGIATGQELYYEQAGEQADVLARFATLWSMLLEAGADPLAVNAAGETAQERAAAGSSVLAQFFQSQERERAAQAHQPASRARRHRS